MFDNPRFILHAEGAAVLTVSLAAYHELHGSWLLFFLLYLWPDLFMLGYLVNPRLGAMFYNLVHTEVGPLFLGAAAVFENWHNTLLFAIIWLAHIALDRMLGYGLKYPTFFKDTHLQRVAQG
jgi:hypothetical protein